MFSRFMPLALIRASQHEQAVQDRHRTRRDRRPSQRTRARFRLERLEDRCLLASVASITEIPLPSGSSFSPGMQFLTVGPDDNIWFADGGANAIGNINPTTHDYSLYTIPTANAGPRGITVGPDGNIWFTEYLANKIGTLNLTTHVFSEFTLPTGYTHWANITAGPDGNLWFTTNYTANLGEINPTTHAITIYSLTGTGNGPNDITAGPDGNVWFTWSGADELGNIQSLSWSD